MGSAAAPERPKPNWFQRLLMAAFRIFFLTLLFTALGMALGLTTGILVTIIGSAVSHHPIDMTRAYRLFAIPTAVVVGLTAFVYNLVRSVSNALKA